MQENLIHGTETGLTTEHTQVVIDKLGRVQIEGKNFTGSACSIMGDTLRRSVAGPNDTSEPKPEMFQESTNEQHGTNW